MDIQFTDNSQAVLNALKNQIEQGLIAVGETAEGYAKEGAPVDTGRLRNDITYKVNAEEYEVQVGTNVEYAPYQEYGDNYSHKTGGAHFLRNSLSNHVNEYKAILEAALR